MTESVPQSVGTTTHSCESCGMPIETGRWCTYCTSDSGELQPFEERFARMVAWQERRHPEQSRADAEAASPRNRSAAPRRYRVSFFTEVASFCGE